MQTTSTTTNGDMATVSTPMTADELLQLPRGKHRYELIKGELRAMSPVGPQHGRIAMRLGSLIEQHVRQPNLGVVYAAETGFKLHENPDTVRAADATYVAQDRIPPEGEPEGYWAIVPDLVVEVVSPSDSALEVQDKVADWLDAGCRLVWVVYPNTETVTEYRSLTEIRVFTADQTLEGGEVLPGFACPIHEFFA